MTTVINHPKTDVQHDPPLSHDTATQEAKETITVIEEDGERYDITESTIPTVPKPLGSGYGDDTQIIEIDDVSDEEDALSDEERNLQLILDNNRENHLNNTQQFRENGRDILEDTTSRVNIPSVAADVPERSTQFESESVRSAPEVVVESEMAETVTGSESVDHSHEMSRVSTSSGEQRRRESLVGERNPIELGCDPQRQPRENGSRARGEKESGMELHPERPEEAGGGTRKRISRESERDKETDRPSEGKAEVSAAQMHTTKKSRSGEATSIRNRRRVKNPSKDHVHTNGMEETNRREPNAREESASTRVRHHREEEEGEQEVSSHTEQMSSEAQSALDSEIQPEQEKRMGAESPSSGAWSSDLNAFDKGRGMRKRVSKAFLSAPSQQNKRKRREKRKARTKKHLRAIAKSRYPYRPSLCSILKSDKNLRIVKNHRSYKKLYKNHRIVKNLYKNHRIVKNLYKNLRMYKNHRSYKNMRTYRNLKLLKNVRRAKKPTVSQSLTQMSVTWLSHDTTRQDHPFCLKVFGAESSVVGENERSYLEELNKIDKEDHGHIIRMREAFWLGNFSNVTIITEYGRTLRSYLNEGPMNIDQVRHLALQILTSLILMDNNGLVHMGIDLDNVVITQNPHSLPNHLHCDGSQHYYKLSNLSHTFRNDLSRTRGIEEFDPSVNNGTPEMLFGYPLTHKTDTWSLGMLLLECVKPEMGLYSTLKDEHRAAFLSSFIGPLSFFQNSPQWGAYFDGEGMPRYPTNGIQPLSSLLNGIEVQFFDFVRGLLEPDISVRLSALEAFTHPFLFPKTIDPFYNMSVIHHWSNISNPPAPAVRSESESEYQQTILEENHSLRTSNVELMKRDRVNAEKEIHLRGEIEEAKRGVERLKMEIAKRDGYIDRFRDSTSLAQGVLDQYDKEG
ncbi:TRAF3-interacting protein 1 isoform 1 [Planoprotostelium fungivorum]|uniref:TRAF3-interacting protein 1 isoform 1 n=1 Tax=Planoprotostelium fungivorum TaxID=1890364 RepID=A0A2P6NSL5_9EUKA|nr:TRAF3-interacting protein 1 isoform 1 [Planoprotostelium fungivorum]